MSPVSFHLHKYDLTFRRDICDNVKLTASVPAAWPHIPPNDAPAHSLQMRNGDILAPAATPDTGVHVPYSGRMSIAKDSFNNLSDHLLSFHSFTDTRSRRGRCLDSNAKNMIHAMYHIAQSHQLHGNVSTHEPGSFTTISESHCIT